MSAAVGVGITKLFKLNSNFENLRWLAGALACGLASATMAVTKTSYPPGGATALLAAIDPTVEHLGWYLLPLVLLSTALILITALMFNNIQRRYPDYWWTPTNVGRASKEDDTEMAPTKNPKNPESLSSRAKSITYIESTAGNSVTITADDTMVPDGFYLSGEEKSILQILQDRLRDGFVRPLEPSAQA